MSSKANSFQTLKLFHYVFFLFFYVSVSDTLPTGQLSNVPWRRSGVKYTNNEAYFDVIEEVDAIIDKSGATVQSEIHGYIDCVVKLSGMPDLSMSFMNPRMFDDTSFHPCVRFKRWEVSWVLTHYFFVLHDHTISISYSRNAFSRLFLLMAILDSCHI